MEGGWPGEARHLLERSRAAPAHAREILGDLAVRAGVDEETALVRDATGTWSVAGTGAVTLYTSSTDTTGQRLPSGTQPIELP